MSDSKQNLSAIDEPPRVPFAVTAQGALTCHQYISNCTLFQATPVFRKILPACVDH